MDWNKIGDAVRTGRYNLLLGAGASVDSKRRLGLESLPTAGGLRQRLEDIQTGLRPGSSIHRLYRSLTPEQVQEEITDRFAETIPGPSVKKITEFRWRRIFTLNVDDALESAYEQSTSPAQRCSAINYDQAYAELRDLSQVQIIHLHGYSRVPQSGYIFDIKQYMRSVSANNIWAHILGNLIRTEPFIVIGSSLEEPDLAYFLADRESIIARSDRAPSVLIEPYPDQGTSDDCEEFSLELFEGDVVQFLNSLEDNYPAHSSVEETISANYGDLFSDRQADPLVSKFFADFERVPFEYLAGIDNGPNFALGHSATWLDIQNSRDIARTETASIERLLTSMKGGSIVLISGDPGSGKTTTMRRLAWDLAHQGALCVWLRSIGRLRADVAISLIKDISSKIYIFIDNFADHATEVAIMQRGLPGRDVVFVGAERDYRFQHIKRVLFGSDWSTRTIRDINEDNVQQLLTVYDGLGLSEIAIRDRSKELVSDLSDEAIAVTCCRILNRFEPLENIIARSFSDASVESQKCYMVVALASHCYRQGLHYNILSAMFPNYHVDLQADEKGPLPIEIVDDGYSEFVIPLNEWISDSILGRCANRNPNQTLDTFKMLSTAIRPYVSLDGIISGSPSSRLASRLFDYDEVVRRLLSVDMAKEFYEHAKKLWSWNSRYWHQVAHLRLNLAEYESDVEIKKQLCELAVQHARHAKTIEPNHQFTFTQIGRTIFGKMRVLSYIGAVELEEAFENIYRAVKLERDRNRVTVHPYFILFRGATDALEYGAQFSHEQRGKLMAAIDSASAEFPRDKELIEQGAVLSREIS